MFMNEYENPKYWIFGVTNKYQYAGQFTNIESANDEDWLYLFSQRSVYSYVGLYLYSSLSMCQSLLMYYIYKQETITANRENWYFFYQVLCFLNQLTVLQRELAEFHLSRWSGFTGFLCSECRQRGNWQAWGIPKLPKSGGLDFGDGTL